MRCRESYRGRCREKYLSTTKVSSKYQATTSSDPRTEAWSIHQVSKSYRWGKSFLDRSTKCQGGVRIAIWKSLRSSIDSKVSRRYRGDVEPLFKTSFSKWEKHRHECNPTCNSINHPINTTISQNHLSIKILKHMDLKNTHIH